MTPESDLVRTVRGAGAVALTAALVGGTWLAADWLAGGRVAALVTVGVLGLVLLVLAEAVAMDGDYAE